MVERGIGMGRREVVKVVRLRVRTKKLDGVSSAKIEVMWESHSS